MNFKKIIAGASIVAISSTLMVGQAVAAAAQIATITETDTNNKIEIDLGADFTDNISDNDVFVVDVKNLKTGVNIDVSAPTSTLQGDDGTFTTTARGTSVELTENGDASTPSKVITLEKTGAFPDTADYLITVTVKAGDNDAGEIFQGFLYKANQNQVNVSASVEPILLMDLDHNSIDFGQLDVNVLKTMTGEITISTNAAGGATLFAQSANTGSMVDIDDANNKIAPATHGEDMSAGTTATDYGYGIRIKGTASGTDIGGYTSNALNADAAYDGAANDFSAMAVTATAVAAQTAGGSNGATVEVEYGVRISPLQPAGQYSDTVTYTITGNF